MLDGSEDAQTVIWTPAWGDVNNDGDLDLFLTLWSLSVPGFFGKANANSRLYIQKNGSFTDQTEAFGLVPFISDQALVSAAFGDFDNDGFSDLFLRAAQTG